MDFWQEHAIRLQRVMKHDPTVTPDFVRSASTEELAERGLERFPEGARERQSVISAIAQLPYR